MATATIKNAKGLGAPGQNGNFDYLTLRTMRTKKAAAGRTAADIFSEKFVITPELESACQISSALLKSLITVANDLRISIEKVPGQYKNHDESATALQKTAIMGTREVLQKCTDLLTTLKIYDEEYSMYDSVLKPTNALVMAGLNLKAKYNEAADSEKAAAIKLSIDLINNYLKVLVTETRTLVATQLCRRLLSAKMGTESSAGSTSVNLAKTIRVITGLQRYILDKSNSNVILQGWLQKRSKNGKNWKKVHVSLHEDKLVYSEKENDAKSAKTILTNTFQDVQDSSDAMKKPLTFTIGGATPVVFTAGNEAEHKDWMLKLGEVMRNNFAVQNQINVQQINWSVFKEADLRDFLKSYDREEKYQIETTRIFYLQKMKEVLRKLNELQGDGKAHIPENSKLESKAAEYEESKRRKEKFAPLFDDPKALLEAVKADPEGFISNVSGLSLSDFVC